MRKEDACLQLTSVYLKKVVKSMYMDVGGYN